MGSVELALLPEITRIRFKIPPLCQSQCQIHTRISMSKSTKISSSTSRTSRTTERVGEELELCLCRKRERKRSSLFKSGGRFPPPRCSFPCYEEVPSLLRRWRTILGTAPAVSDLFASFTVCPVVASSSQVRLTASEKHFRGCEVISVTAAASLSLSLSLSRSPSLQPGSALGESK